MGMIDTDKVLIGLGQHISGRTPERCGICPYFNGDSGYGVTCRDELLDDLYEMLEAMEPRVVKISELTSGEPMLVWLEDIDKDETVAGMIFDYVPGRIGFKLTNIGGMDRIYPLIEEYLKRWRCWNTKPSKEDMEAELWETEG